MRTYYAFGILLFLLILGVGLGRAYAIYGHPPQWQGCGIGSSVFIIALILSAVIHDQPVGQGSAPGAEALPCPARAGV
jgi:hypothetical protein